MFFERFAYKTFKKVTYYETRAIQNINKIYKKLKTNTCSV